MRSSRVKLEEETAVYHCISRVVWGTKVLHNQEMETLRKILKRTATFCGVEILTYCIMKNHLHLLVKVPYLSQEEISDEELVRRYQALSPIWKPKAGAHLKDILEKKDSYAEVIRQKLVNRMGDVSIFHKELKHRFTLWFNQTHGKFGTMWSGRFKSILVESSERSLLTVAAYIDLNPVRAGICRDPKDYRWSGYGEAVGGGGKWNLGCMMYDLGLGKKEEGREGMLRKYRQLLYVEGERGKGLRSSKGGREPGKRISREEVKKVLEEKGTLSVAEALRCRVRYFSDGGILGSEAFIERWFKRYWHEGAPQSVRKSGARKMKGAEWGELMVLRGLQKRVIE